MKLLFALILLAGFGFWMAKEIQHEQELQTQLDEARREIEEMKKQSQAFQQSRPPQQSGISQDRQWMWNPSNNVFATPTPGGKRR